jgi:hypothetical protein
VLPARPLSLTALALRRLSLLGPLRLPRTGLLLLPGPLPAWPWSFTGLRLWALLLRWGRTATAGVFSFLELGPRLPSLLLPELLLLLLSLPLLLLLLLLLL